MESQEKKIHIEIISPSGVVYDDHCNMVTIPGSDGDLGIMLNHEPILTSLKKGKISIYNNNNISKEIDIVGGYAHNVEDKIIILLDEEQVESQ